MPPVADGHAKLRTPCTRHCGCAWHSGRRAMASESRALTRPFNGVTVPVAGTYTLDPPHTFAYFSVQHLVVGRVRGRFDALSGTIKIAESPLSSTVVVQIETASIS